MTNATGLILGAVAFVVIAHVVFGQGFLPSVSTGYDVPLTPGNDFVTTSESFYTR